MLPIPRSFNLEVFSGACLICSRACSGLASEFILHAGGKTARMSLLIRESRSNKEPCWFRL